MIDLSDSIMLAKGHDAHRFPPIAMSTTIVLVATGCGAAALL